jgi:parallel beta-helix repeat protein
MASSYTANLNLAKPAKGDVDWDDEINGNSDVLDVAVGTEHSADGHHKNTICLGDNSNIVDKKIVANTGEANEPYLSYDVSEDEFVVANDGQNAAAILTRPANILEVAKSGKRFSTIAAAISAAETGDTILVYTGTYDQSSSPLVVSQAVHLKAVGKVTITGSPVDLQYVMVVTAAAVIEGFEVILTGSGCDGGAMKISASAEVRECRVVNNGIGSSSVGVYCIGSEAKIVNCSIQSVVAFEAVHIGGGAAGCIVDNCTISSNGGGMYVSSGANDLLIQNCDILAGGSNYGITFVAGITGAVIRSTIVRKAGSASECVHATGSLSAKIYQCCFNLDSGAIDADITNLINSPYNVSDEDL